MKRERDREWCEIYDENFYIFSNNNSYTRDIILIEYPLNICGK